MDDTPARQLDRGPRSSTDDPPRSPRGMWRLLQMPDIDASRATAIATHYPTWAALEQTEEVTLTRHVGAKVATHVLTHGIPDAELPTTIDADVLTPWTPGYPRRLASIPGAPPLLWVRGQLPTAGRALTIVGSRDANPYGTAVAERAGRTAATHNLLTVSGLAPGIDTTVAVATLDNGGVHLAILGSGIDTPRDPALADRIVAAGGAILTEQPPGIRATGRTLVARNRLQTALGDATLIAAAAARSGTAHTARFAIAQQRPLWSPRPTGPHAAHASAQLTVALTDPNGTDPTLLHATGRLANLIANRRPCADQVIPDGDTLDDAIRTLAGKVS